MTTRSIYNLIGITALLVVFAVIFFSRRADHSGKVFVHVESLKTPVGWGYKILADERVYIRQEFIPAIPGYHAFASESDALKVGHLVVDKIGRNQMPAISIRELDSLGIAYGGSR